MFGEARGRFILFSFGSLSAKLVEDSRSQVTADRVSMVIVPFIGPELFTSNTHPSKHIKWLEIFKTKHTSI